MISLSTVSVLLLATLRVEAHCNVWSVWVNGIDQGTEVGVRNNAYNGPVGPGYKSSPIRDIDSIDMRCGVMGDVPNPHTIKITPGDIVTFEWRNADRQPGDLIIDKSHKGAGMVYISPDPPTNNSWVKIQEEAEMEPHKWYTGDKMLEHEGKQDVKIPYDLAPGFYLLRTELNALHEAETNRNDNMNRGIQFYVGCVQIEIVGNGTTTLPPGVDFPGAYKYSDPGIVYNYWWTEPAVTALYPIPGPTVWAKAEPSPDSPEYGTTKGRLTQTWWSTWIGGGFQTETLATSVTVIRPDGATLTTSYTPDWPTVYIPPKERLSSREAQWSTVTPVPTPPPTPTPSTPSPSRVVVH